MTDQPQPESEGERCPDCENDGYVDIVDEKTGGVIGPRPCPNPDCPVSGPSAIMLEDLDGERTGTRGWR